MSRKTATATRGLKGGAIGALVIVIFSGCALFQTVTPDAPEERTVPGPDPTAALLEPERPGRAATAEVLAGLPQREITFLEQFQQRVEAGQWEWVTGRAEEDHYRELVQRTGMDEESYLTFLLRMGESFDHRIRRDDAEPGYFSPYDTVEVVFTDYRKQSITTVVEGLLYNSEKRSIDFTITLLGELAEIRLTGAYY